MSESRLDDLATRYKKAVAGRYRAIAPGEINTMPRGKCFASPKIDGELWFAELADGQATLFARGGRRLADSPIVVELASAATRFNANIVVAGELYVRGGDPRPRVGDVATALASGKHDRLGFKVFDVVESGGGPPPAAYDDRLAILRRLFVADGAESVGVVETEEVSDPSALAALVPDWVSSGRAEGMIVRTAAGEVFKVKPSFTLDAVVCGFTTKAEEPDQARSLLMGLIRPDGAVLLVGAGGNMAGAEVRRDVLRALLDHECESRFRHSSSDGALYRFVKPHAVVEVTCTDLQFEDSSGDLIRKWVIRHEEDTWHPVVDAQSVSLIHPVISRIRTDKGADDLDARVSQLEERVIAGGFTEKLAPRLMSTSTLVKREVWTKVSKTGAAVRKLLVWKTGKEAQWPGWPAWIVHFTDYSPDRKTPLDRTMRTALTEAEAMAVAAEMVEENIKKGWEPLSANAFMPPSRPVAGIADDVSKHEADDEMAVAAVAAPADTKSVKEKTIRKKAEKKAAKKLAKKAPKKAAKKKP
jgi:ATP-dependent DNA ligase